ncbi:hypothetical protein OEZ85_000736 [Tetradesmus obliquus]|uniref:S-adenosyl-L-methionine-dependent methyltransferase n=1 Tax=Tetradesmus obliquus TaxID=3088 RepID=A0ABY8UJI7_TETOB|nr:hypothetical protein OEZ85_000736 [Tetradesmus obliquus]
MADVALAAAPAGIDDIARSAAARKDSGDQHSAFHKITEDDAAALRDNSDNQLAGDLPAGKLASLVSGPLLHSAATISDLDTVRDVPFDQLCNSGSKLTSKNIFNKLLFRYFLTPIKDVYLPFMTWGLPTNFLMLTFRTYNRDFGLPNHNDDNLAQDLRDTLMPARGKLHRERSLFLKFKTGLLDTPYLGIPGIVNFIDVRTQWFDAAVKKAIADGITQVVIIAAGYDTRAYRLGKPGVKFYEIDLPHASETKQQLVKKHMPADKYTWPEFIGADLSKVALMDALNKSSWDSTRRTMFIIEGLVYYLPPEAFKKSLTGISETAVAGSRLFFDFLHLDALSNEIVMPGLETLLVSVWNKGESMYSGIDHRPEALRSLLKKFGFRLHEVMGAQDISRRYHPHVQSWNPIKPHVAPFFGYVAAEKVMAPIKRQETIRE